MSLTELHKLYLVFYILCVVFDHIMQSTTGIGRLVYYNIVGYLTVLKFSTHSYGGNNEPSIVCKPSIKLSAVFSVLRVGN